MPFFVPFDDEGDGWEQYNEADWNATRGNDRPNTPGHIRRGNANPRQAEA